MAQLMLLLLLLWAGVTVANVQRRIIQGELCAESDRRYHVQLMYSNRTHAAYCGGSLISRQWILTATHCWPLLPGWTMYANLGVHPGPGQLVQISAGDRRAYTDANGLEHDIMLLKLPPQPKYIKLSTIALPDCSKDKNQWRLTSKPSKNELVQIAGHGAITANPDGSRVPNVVDNLHCADLSVATCKNPSHKDPSQASWQEQRIFCAQGPKQDVCQGDSGGGVMYKDQIYGVISFTGTFALTVPAGFMDVCEYKQWITSVSGNTLG